MGSVLSRLVAWVGCVVLASVVMMGCPRQVTVPDVVGQPQGAAETAITGAGLVVGTVTQQASATVAAGNVISQDPAAGASVEEGSGVSLVVSTGPGLVVVPNVVGSARAAAESAIVAAGLTVGTVTLQSSASVATGNVISQNPGAGTNADAGSAVNLVVSTGTGTNLVPNVIGSTRAAAEEAILAAGLTVGAVTSQASFTVPAGSVLNQNPVGGSLVGAGTSVALVISLGPQIVNVPNVVGSTQAEANTAILAVGLTLGAVTHQISNTVPAGRVISQDPVGGAGAPVGWAVTLVVSVGAGVNVPNVVGLTRVAAEAAIVAAGLTVGVVTEQFSDNVPGVLSQDPFSGTPVALGTAVNIVVSLGPACTQVKVPNVAGLTTLNVNGALGAVGLTLGTVTEAYSPTFPRGLISGQNPVVDTCVAAGSAVNITLSLGQEPIVINDLAELRKIGNDPGYPVTANYALGNDIDALASGKGGPPFVPISSSGMPFVGEFDGHNFTISGLVINQPLVDGVGLFASVGEFGSPRPGAVIRNVNLSGGSVTGHNNTGAMVGLMSQATVSNCHTNVPVTGEQSIGGLIGFVAGGAVVEDSSAAGPVVSVTLGSISAQSDAIGGFVGLNFAELRDCSASGAVDGGPHGTATGGFVGQNLGLVTNCSASGNVTSPTVWVGGFMGLNIASGVPGSGQGDVRDCQGSGDVDGSGEVGGLIGRNFGNHTFTISRCRATGNVTAQGIGGGLIGNNIDGDVVECVAEGNVFVSYPEISSGDIAGGLIGLFTMSMPETPSEIRDCYALGSVTGRLYVGGLIGSASPSNTNFFSGPVIRCYAAGSVNGANESGGLIGHVRFEDSPVVGCFWDTNTTGFVTSEGGGTGLGTSQMMTGANFTAAGWDFATVWDIEEGASYPFLRWTAE